MTLKRAFLLSVILTTVYSLAFAAETATNLSIKKPTTTLTGAELVKALSAPTPKPVTPENTAVPATKLPPHVEPPCNVAPDSSNMCPAGYYCTVPHGIMQLATCFHGTGVSNNCNTLQPHCAELELKRRHNEAISHEDDDFFDHNCKANSPC